MIFESYPKITISMKFITLLCAVLLANHCYSQQNSDSVKLIKPVVTEVSKKINIRMMTQFWSVYTQNEIDKSGKSVNDRVDFYIRRGRFGADGNLTNKLSYNVTFAFDNTGKDQYSGTFGTAQSSANKDFYLFDAFATYSLHPRFANITFGYFRPQVGRENITSKFQINSIETALTNFYQRTHLIGRSSGRETGVNLGGLYQHGWIGVNYNLGIFDPNYETIAGVANGGKYFSPLYTGRLAISFGDPEMKTYGLGYKINYFNERKGVTVSANYAIQGRTNETWVIANNKYFGGFKQNSLTGFDLLFNWKNLSVDAEYELLSRSFSDTLYSHHQDILAGKSYTDNVWHIRAGYTVKVFNKYLIEPCVMYSKFEGDAKSIIYPNGSDNVLDGGINFYINKNNLKLNLHYVSSWGASKSMYSSGKDQRGDVIVLGFQYIY
jgi:hypothetical protein